MSKKNNPVQKLIVIVLLSVLVLPGLYSCHKHTFVAENRDQKPEDEKSAQLVKADNAFGFDLFQKLKVTGTSENLLVSPFSISVAFAMAYNGAGAETKAEMENVLKLQGLTIGQLNEAYKRLISDLQSTDENVHFKMANALYYARGFNVESGYISVNQEVYNAKVEDLDFSSPAAVATINNWVKDKTEGKIEEIIQQLKPLDRMVLLNAVYFYGTWSKEFDEEGTQNRAFTKSNGSTVHIPMMNKLDTLPYVSTDSFKAIKLPYGSGKYNMVVLLPRNENNSQDIINNLSAENWESWMNQMKVTERVDVTMPRFKFAFETPLKDVLSGMGMQKAFIPEEADFSGISDEQLFISEAKHKSFIDVNETGTEAAAVTSVGFSITSFQEEPPTVPFYVDRPFIFAVTENATGAVLFLGEVKNPEY